MAYAIYMPALYMPIIAMLLALVFRGVAFEYRWRTKRWKRWWDRAFIRRLARRGLHAGHRAGRTGPGHPSTTAPMPAAGTTG
jgi:cytochrome d ubiquinol oxidase subunit II